MKWILYQKKNNMPTSKRISNRNLLPTSVKDRNVQTISADKITAGTVIVQIPIGAGGATDGYILIDGENNRIIVNDGTYDRVLIGYSLGGF